MRVDVSSHDLTSTMISLRTHDRELSPFNVPLDRFRSFHYQIQFDCYYEVTKNIELTKNYWFKGFNVSKKFCNGDFASGALVALILFCT